MFDRKGVIELDNVNDLDEDDLMMMALDAGAEDVELGEGAAVIYTDPGEFSAVREKLEGMGCAFLSAERGMVPNNMVSVDDEGAAKIQRLLDLLDDNDDVQNVYHNADLPDDGEDE
jgi:transcriptional/translational regulatory protein YebC/TACO1